MTVNTSTTSTAASERYSDEHLDELAKSPFIGNRAKSHELRRLATVSERQEAVARMHRLMNRVPGRPSQLLADVVTDMLSNTPEYQPHQHS